MDTKALRNNKVIADLRRLLTGEHDSIIAPTYINYKVYLTGGSVIDILEGRTPKDYDFIDYNGRLDNKLSEDNRYIFEYETKTSRTFYREGVKIQILKTKWEGFDFTISQSMYDIVKDELHISQECFDKKLLVPVSFTDKKQVLNSLARIPHWRNKGYEIRNESYFSLLNYLNETLVDNIREEIPYKS